MKECKITLESDVLDPSFVSKARDFEEKVKNNQLSDEEIKAGDEELVNLFKTLHNITEEDPPSVKEAQHKKDIAEARAAIAEAGTIKDILLLKEQYQNITDVLPLIDKKIEKLEKIEAQSKKAAEDQKAQFIVDAKSEINAAKYDNLQALGEKYNDYPELVEMIKKRHSDEKPQKENEELAAKLHSKKEWSYVELKGIGINPTGNDMVVAGVKLEKEFLFPVYVVIK